MKYIYHIEVMPCSRQVCCKHYYGKGIACLTVASDRPNRRFVFSRCDRVFSTQAGVAVMCEMDTFLEAECPIDSIA